MNQHLYEESEKLELFLLRVLYFFSWDSYEEFLIALDFCLK